MAENTGDHGSFQMTITGPGMKVDLALDEQRVVQILAAAYGQVAPISRSDEGRVGTPLAGEVSISEFLKGLQIKNNPERLAGIIMYVKEVRGESPVDKTDIPQWFQKAGESPPKNLSRDLKGAVKASLISEDHDKAGHYFVTTTGQAQLRSAQPKT